MWHEGAVQHLESFDNPSEYVPYHVGRTHLHRQLDTDRYFAARVKEDSWALHRHFNKWPGDEGRSIAPNFRETPEIMENLYRIFTQHKWLPLQTAWPFNLRMVTFVLIHTDICDAIAADKLVKRIRSWGCPVSPFGDGYDEWTTSNSRDVMFNLFRDFTGRPLPKYKSAISPLSRDLDRIAAMIQRGR